MIQLRLLTMCLCHHTPTPLLVRQSEHCASVRCRVTQANAKQRSGRAGRVQAGTCYRLYPRALHELMPAFLAPEMQRTPLENVALQIKSIGALPKRSLGSFPSWKRCPECLVFLLNTLCTSRHSWHECRHAVSRKVSAPVSQLQSRCRANVQAWAS